MLNKALYKFCGKTKKFIFVTVFINAVKLLASIAFAYLFSSIIVQFVDNGKLNLKLLALIAGIIILKVILIRLANFFNLKIIKEVKHKLRANIYAKVFQLGMGYQNSMTTQEITHLGVEGVEQLENYFGSYLAYFYYCFIASGFLFLAVAPLDLRTAIILMVAALTIPLSLQAIMGIVRRTQKKYWKKYTAVGNLFLDSLSGLTTLKIFRADKRQAEIMDEQAENFRKQTMRVLGMQLNSIMIIDWIAYGSTAIALALAITRFANAEINLHSMIMILLHSAEFFVPMRTLTSLFHIAMTGVAAGEQILEFLTMQNFKLNKGITINQNNEIEITNFSYSYPNGKQALQNIDLKILPNKVTAIVGHSGCGKSTLASIIAQTLDEQNKMKAVRISHEPYIFARTVKENILMGRENISDEEIIAVLKKLKLWNFLQEQEGLQTKLLAGGKNISGGQAQRLAIARALLGDFSVYIFDETTSNIDVDSENIILELINEIAKEKTVIYISHKMRAIASADSIFVMESGTIAESGTHSQLLKKEGVYFKLYMEQEQLLNFAKDNSNKICE